MHRAVPVEVVPLAADPLGAGHGLPVGGVEVVPLAADLLPARQLSAAGAKVAPGGVGSPPQPPPMHRAVPVEVVPLAADPLGPTHRFAIFVKVIPLAIDLFPGGLNQ